MGVGSLHEGGPDIFWKLSRRCGVGAGLYDCFCKLGVLFVGVLTEGALLSGVLCQEY